MDSAVLDKAGLTVGEIAVLNVDCVIVRL